jgi:hypothetical protein
MKNRWLPFEEAREFVRSLGLKDIHDWYAFSKGPHRPYNIPSAPCVVYRGHGWKGIKDWLGTNGGKWRPFKQARRYVRTLYLEGADGWNEFVKSGKNPSDIPPNPECVYKDSGWIDYRDWTGHPHKRPAKDTTPDKGSTPLSSPDEGREQAPAPLEPWPDIVTLREKTRKQIENDLIAFSKERKRANVLSKIMSPEDVLESHRITKDVEMKPLIDMKMKPLVQHDQLDSRLLGNKGFRITESDIESLTASFEDLDLKRMESLVAKRRRADKVFNISMYSFISAALMFYLFISFNFYLFLTISFMVIIFNKYMFKKMREIAFIDDEIKSQKIALEHLSSVWSALAYGKPHEAYEHLGRYMLVSDWNNRSKLKGDPS